MRFAYTPRSNAEKFGVTVYQALVENFSTYYVGGMVRDMLLHKKIKDIDLVTTAIPHHVQTVLRSHHITVDTQYQKFGIISAIHSDTRIEIATMRQDSAGKGRYPKVRFITSLKQDSNRRDFTINALYYSLKSQQVIDYHNGLADLDQRIIRFIGSPKRKIAEDPLRIIRALRFQLQLKFKLEQIGQQVIQNNFSLIRELSQNKIDQEIEKLPTKNLQLRLRRIINRLALDDKPTSII